MTNKKKILWIGDDIRMNSGCSTASREIILGCIHKYDFACIAGAITHPDKGKVFDLSQSTNEMKKINDAYVKLYPTDGYGNEQILFNIIAQENPSAICMITDPRFYGWLFALEKQIRVKIPICYWNIWDLVPYPMYNKAFYESCDALFSISKQTFNINKHVLGEKNVYTLNEAEKQENKKDFIKNKSLIQYVPHGIDSETFKPLHKYDPKLREFRKNLFGGKDYEYVIFYNSRNVQRKRTSNIMLAYRTFCENLTKEESDKCVLVLHTEIMCEAGTNLLAIKEAFCPDNNIIFSCNKIIPEQMCYLYNIADITVNASSSEGFGLSTAESIMCGTPIIVNVTGGLQDQIGQVDDSGNPIEFDVHFGTNNIGKYKNHGRWAYPVWPVSRLVQGSIPTPYIFDDVSRWEDFAEGFMYWYLLGDEKRVEYGNDGRKWSLGSGGLNARNMCNKFIDGMDFIFDNWTPPKRYNLFSNKDYVGNLMPDGMGFEIPKIDKEKIKEKIGL